MKKYRKIFYTALVLNVIIVLYLVTTLNKRKATTFICTISGSKKVTIVEYFKTTENVYSSSLETWIKNNMDTNFKNNFVIRSQRIEPLLGGISRGSGGRVPIARVTHSLDDIVKYNSFEKLSFLVKALESGKKEEGNKAIDTVLDEVYNQNGINELFKEK